MMRTFPTCELLAHTLSKLYDKKVRVTPFTDKEWLALKSYATAIYRTDDNNIRCLGIGDIEFLAYTGAALTVTPCNLASTAIARGVLDEHLRLGSQETFNILARTLNEVDIKHTKLDKLMLRKERLSPITQEIVQNPSQIQQYQVEIAGYGTAHLAFLYP